MSYSDNSAQTSTRGELTAREIRQAIVRIEKGRPRVVKPGRKLSIKSVAEEAGVSRATIHNNVSIRRTAGLTLPNLDAVF